MLFVVISLSEFLEIKSLQECYFFDFSQLNPSPDFIQERIALFDQLKAEYDAKIEGTLNFMKKIIITLDPVCY